MPDIEIIDRTNQLPTVAEFDEALQAVGDALIKDIANVPPYLGIHLALVHRCLKVGRAFICELDKRGGNST